MSGKNRNLSLTAYDELFQPAEERQESSQERIQTLPLELFHPFPEHPFQVRDDEKMEDTARSIAQFGVLVPILARPRPEGGYEIVSGHRRHHASQMAGLKEIPAIIRNMDDDEATIVMVDSNLQREQILPSEKAFAYKMKLDAMRRKAGRPAKENVSQFGTQKRSDQLLAEQAGESRNQVQRYIRLTHLVPPILDMVDEGNFAFNAAVEISYLPEEHQKVLLEAMDYAQASPSLAQARRIRAFLRPGSWIPMCWKPFSLKKSHWSGKSPFGMTSSRNTSRPPIRPSRWKRSLRSFWRIGAGGKRSVMTVEDKEYDCLTCPYPRYKTPELIYCDVCIRRIMDKHRNEMEVKHDTDRKPK